MGKQRCGSCRFFEDVGIAGSGWCHHPLRRTSGDLLIMVRRNELACRDQWSRSLWEEGSFGGGDADGTSRNGALPPLSAGELARFVDRGRETDDSGSAEPQDVVLGEARLVGDGTPPWRRTTLDDIPVDAPPVRSHESTGRAAFARLPLPSRRASGGGGRAQPFEPDGPTSAGVAPENRGPEASRDTTVAEAKPEPPSTAGLEAEVEAVPDVAIEETLVLEVDDDLWQQQANAGAAPAAAAVDMERIDAEGPVVRDRRSPRAGRSGPATTAAAQGGSSASSGAAPKTFRESQRIEGRGAASDANAPDILAPERSGSDASNASPPRPAGRFGRFLGGAAGAAGSLYHDAEVDRSGYEGRAVGGSQLGPRQVAETPSNAGDRGAAPRAATAEAVSADLKVPGPATLDLAAGPTPTWIPEPPTVAPALPRICRTCRDFRAGESGGSGWCANTWAFRHRQVVTADSQPACEGAVGSWWLPTDELRIEPVDVSAYAQPTPLLDRWLPGEKVSERQRRPS